MSCKQIGTLWLVSTPIGNLKDLTFRALTLLQEAALIVCEDTRVTRKLFEAHGLTPPHLWTYHEHNAISQRPKILESLLEGKTVALVSDAGTPLICDPGFKLVKAAQDRGIPVTAAPGVSAVTAALSLSGLPTNTFYFAGFIPRKAGERKKLFQDLAQIPTTLIFYESAKRTLASLEEMLPYFKDREGVMAREVTKLFEEIIRHPFQELVETLRTRPALKGEVVLLVGPPLEQEVSEAQLSHALEQAFRTKTFKEAVISVSQGLKVSRKKVYDKALEIRNNA